MGPERVRWFRHHEIQGEEAQIDRVIMAIERGIYVRIEDMDIRNMEVRNGETGFRVR